MKIEHLRAGDLFQFKLQRKPGVYRVLDPATSYCEVAGFYDRGTLRSVAMGDAGWWSAFDDVRPVKSVAKQCAESPTGMHDFTPDVEYDAANPPSNCEHCGEPDPDDRGDECASGHPGCGNGCLPGEAS